MAATIVEVTTATQASGTSIDVPVPPGTQEGDLLVVLHRDQAQTVTVYAGNAAFNHIDPPFEGANSQSRLYGAWWRIATDSEPSSYNFARSAGATRSVAAMLRITGFDPNDPIDVTATQYVQTSIAGGRRMEALTPARNGLYILWSGNELIEGYAHELPNPPGGFTEVASFQTGEGTTASRTAMWVGARAVTAGSQVPAQDIVWTSSSGTNVHGFVIADAGTTFPGLSLWDGSVEVPLSGVSLWDGSEEVPLARAGHTGSAYTVSAMEADIANGVPVWWAHRGCGHSWSEMTQYAYDNAVAWGFKALEFSARRTSDGVWIGMHDPDLDRVTSLTGNVSSYTWEDLEGTPVIAPAPGGVIMRIEDFLERYERQVLIVDPKSQAYTYRTEVFALLKSIPDWQERIVVKLDGMHNQGVFEAYKAEGFKIAGYWYDNESSLSALADRAEFTDYIGMDFGASEPTWSTVFGYGKPVWGHVLRQVWELQAAQAAGCHIFQCSNAVLKS